MPSSRPADTPQHVEQLLVAAWREMPPWQKIQRVIDLCESAEAFARAGIRARHPDLADAEVERRLAELRLGPELMAVLDEKQRR